MKLKALLLSVTTLFLVYPTLSFANPAETTKSPAAEERLRITKNLVLPHHIAGAAAISKAVTPVKKPKGIRVKYLAPRLIKSAIYVQSLGEFDAEKSDLDKKIMSFAKGNIFNLRKKGIEDTSFLPQSITNKMSDTQVAYNMVYRGDKNKTLHLFTFAIDAQLILVQTWTDGKAKFKKEADTFVFNLIQELEKQI